jgi:hypothetical protein
MTAIKLKVGTRIFSVMNPSKLYSFLPVKVAGM